MPGVKSIVFHPKTKQKIENHWEHLSPQAKALILALEKQADQYQKKAAEQAIKKDPNSPSIFSEALTHKAALAKGKALERVENIEDEEALLEIDKTLNQL